MELATVTPFTPFASLFGGVLIGLSAVMVMAIFGSIAGISGISRVLFSHFQAERPKTLQAGWQLAFLVGLIAAPLAYGLVTGALPAQTVPTSLVGMAVAGLLVGLGTTWGSGCTSGHGVCGLARFSPRSLAAVLTFMGTGAVTVFVLRHMI